MFNGPDYSPGDDEPRLLGQHERIRDLMLDGRWRTLAEIASETNDPAASISAQLRHLRKPRFGSWIVEKRTRGERQHGLYEYRLLPGDGRPAVARGPAKPRNGAGTPAEAPDAAPASMPAPAAPAWLPGKNPPTPEDLRRALVELRSLCKGRKGGELGPALLRLERWMSDLVEPGLLVLD
jgi:hypothetical protein